MKYDVYALSLRPDGTPVVTPATTETGVRCERIDTLANEIFRGCMGPWDVEDRYEGFWNRLNESWEYGGPPRGDVVKVVSVVLIATDACPTANANGSVARTTPATRRGHETEGGSMNNRWSQEGRYVARFHPQAWIGGYAAEVDEEERTYEWDVTDYLAVISDSKRELTTRADTYESDALREMENAPKWVRLWQGPFYVEVRPR